MEAARLLYGELELDASQGLFAVNQMDEGIDLLNESIVESQEGLQSLGDTLTDSSQSANTFSDSLANIGSALGGMAILFLIGDAIYEILSTTQGFQKVLQSLQKAFEPLVKVVKQFAEFIGKYIADTLLVAIKYLSQFINYLTKTEQGLALLKVAAIFFAITAAVLLIASLKAIAISAYSAMTAFIAMITPMLPFIAIGLAVAAALTAIVLVMEDLYFFAMGGKESIASDFFTELGLSKEEIEEVRQNIKDFIETVQKLWKGFTEGFTKVIPQLKKIYGAMFMMTKSFFVTMFKLVYEFTKVFSGAWDIIKGLFTGNFDLIIGGFKRVANGITGIFKGAADYIITVFDNVMKMIEPIKEIAKTFFSGKQQPIAGARAEGGSVQSGKSYLVGEKGAEIFTPNSNGEIIPNSKIQNVSSNTQSSKTMVQSIIGNVSITINAGENMGTELANKVKEIIRQASIEAGQELGLVL